LTFSTMIAANGRAENKRTVLTMRGRDSRDETVQNPETGHEGR
jgi:hypothetical protein